MSIRKVVAGLLITAGIAIMAVPFFWRTTGEKQTEQLIREFEQTLEDDYDEEIIINDKTRAGEVAQIFVAAGIYDSVEKVPV